MANPTPRQQAIRARFERVIGLAAPALDLMLAAGERLARITGPEDEYYPIRSGGESFGLDAPDGRRSAPPDSGPGPEA